MPWTVSPRHIPLSRVNVDRTEKHLLARSTYWEIYEATYGATSVAALCYRHSSRHDALWAATNHYFDEMLAMLHPVRLMNLVQIIGLVYDFTAASEDAKPLWLLFEKVSMSLYDALYTHCIPLSDADIIQIAVQVAQTIVFCNGVGLGHLTSRKVLLESKTRVKIMGLFQRDILEMANAPLAPSAYEPPAPAQGSDVYAFGVLLWEICCSEKPTLELFHHISKVRIARPGLELAEDLVRVCTHEDAELRPTAKDVLDELLAFQISLASRLDDPPPPLQLPSEAVVAQTLQRLQAVEHQVLEEQRNFDVVVGQLEFANAEIASLQKLLEGKVEAFAALDAAHGRALDTIVAYEARIKELEASLSHQVARGAELQHEQHHLEAQCLHQKEQLARSKLDTEAALAEALRSRRELEALSQALQAAEVALEQEKSMTDELSVRWQQTIKRCQEEQLQREKVEQHLTRLRQENKDALDQLRDWHPETGILARQRQIDNERQVETHVLQSQALVREMVAFQEEMAVKASHLAAAQAQCNSLELEILEHQKALGEAKTAHDSAARTCREWEARYAQQTCELLASHEAYATLKTAYMSVEEKLKVEIKQREDEELARKSRRCLDLTCDAPPFLIEQSGYCKDHHEKRERERAEEQRQLDDARRQKPPDDLAAESFSSGGLQGLLGVLEKFRDSPAIAAACCRKLHTLCETQVTYKNELGDLNGFSALVSIATEHMALASIQGQLVRLFGCAAFNHDVNRVRLVCEGALDSVLAAMVAFPQDAPLQQSSCSTLTNLAHNCEGNRRKILDKGGVERVLDAMQGFPKEVALQESACWALISLAGSDYMCQHIAARGGLGAILAAMLNCPGAACVQYYGVWALLNLVTGVEALQEFALQEGAIEVCEAAMACFTEHAGIQDKAQCVIDMLTDNQADSLDDQDELK
ncbi:hypothetical protein ACHHYP_03978 [Achlya hypogyna]|uniref:Protein kinase domain-containing protein n=1 Tax=Achlya hypogyna TaxID=1202772 RepID=A0A1V9ZPG4_ACHHY|nr:hypothetical protein ACHHYP_03978 [Achlya hypogyna]